MTIKSFEAINGHVPIVTHDPKLGISAACVCDCGTEPMHCLASYYTSEDHALKELVKVVLLEHRQIVLMRANFHCQECGRSLALEVDHIVSRAHGRDDRVANLRALCREDHARRHQQKVHPVDFSREERL